MLKRNLLIPQRVGNFKCPLIQEFLATGQYGNAARQLLNSGVPFNQSYLYLSNCPEALIEYFNLLIKEVYMSDAPRKKVICNLYVNILLPQYLVLSPADREPLIAKFIDFVKQNKDFIEKRVLYKSIRECNFLTLLRECYLIFGDYTEYLRLYFEYCNYAAITIDEFNRLMNLICNIPLNEQQILFKSFPLSFMKFIMRNWRTFNRRPTCDPIFPAICDIIFAEPMDMEAVNLLQPIMEKMYTRGKDGGTHSNAQRNLYYILLARTNDQQKMEDYYKNSQWLKLPHDFLLRWLKRRGMETLASQFCAHLFDRHYLAVTYSVIAANKEKSIRPVLDLLTSLLNDAEDRRECWLRALETTSNMKKKDNASDESDGWRTLLETAVTSCVLTLDDIFPIMPENMSIDSFQSTILNAIKEYQTDNSAAVHRIDQFINRASSQRELISRGTQLRVELDPLQQCALCKQSIYKDRFLVFPCYHTVHIKCLLSNMNLFYTAPEMLNLISLTSKAAKSESANKLLSEYISRSCPICGELSVRVLDKDFILKEEVEAREMWKLD
ncbi:hypothetical protein TVAG_287560 [Trichomonas vaginalis G3]|uniref:RING-type domain-containing protein n=1 Tax=Trichomonas vaginalis (strain ATCC PRA-98 / G3) TaxID=412133 RepID=A2FKF5_TRIV3|nr:notochord cell vacuolation [Trichomonas vaginalis G3]EAX94621.1 hypothetical protein TVAG_287560 [Trichomonas vaginalis G3]KAI5553735.1 notochord cell vacuolation [Trichomonas vaginalis G3]|eukprot:XP_001307551.1 hypothetical protein [Trichomonas vaginalis G3]